MPRPKKASSAHESGLAGSVGRERGAAERRDAARPEEGRAEGERRAHAVDPTIKESNLRRLARIEGQIRGLMRMVHSDRYCPEILVQIASVQEALKGVARELVKNHLQHCARQAMRGSDTEAEKAIQELIGVWDKHVS